MSRVCALGFMSGTSMDGVDAAVVWTDGIEDIEYGPSRSVEYTDAVREAFLEARGWDAPFSAARLVEDWHRPQRFDGLVENPELIGFHGQTVAHDPSSGRTLQLGEGPRLAKAWGCPVVWDFRSEDMRHGGEGAPLAPFFHFCALRAKGVRGRVAVVNIGGVANVTWADLDRSDPAEDGALLAFDTGPGNALLDDFMAERKNMRFDENGALAGQGVPSQAVVRDVLEQPYFALNPPKSLDRDTFEQVAPRLKSLSDQDGAATLASLTVQTIALARDHFPAGVDRWLITGGGRKNATMMALLSNVLGQTAEPIEAVGLDGDALESQAFAWLAVRVLRGLPTSASGTTGVSHPICGGQIAQPPV